MKKKLKQDEVSQEELPQSQLHINAMVKFGKVVEVVEQYLKEK